MVLTLLIVAVGETQAQPTAEVVGADAPAPGEQKQPNVFGTIYDSLTAAPLVNATVELVGAKRRTTTDESGSFKLLIAPGPQKLRFAAPGHETRVSSVDVPHSGNVKLDIALAGEQTVLDVVEVFSELARGSVTAQIEERKQAATASENIGAEAIQQSPDADAGEIVQRLSGITVKDDKYIFVRGLGERYSSALLNGSRLPSTNPDKRVVALDLFPSNFIESLSIAKSYTPDLPGDFSGGLVDIRLKDSPDELTYSIGVSTGGNTETTFQDFDSYKGSSTDYFGFGAGYRSLPGKIGDHILDPTTPETTARQRELHRSFKNIWSIDDTTAPPNFGANFSIGDRLGPFGFNFGGTYSNAFQVRRNEVLRTFSNAQGLEDFQNGVDRFQGADFRYDRSKFETQLGGLLTAAYEFRDQDKVALRAFVNRNTSDEVLDGSGYNNNNDGFTVSQTRFLYREEQLGFGQLNGTHEVGIATVDWRSALAQTLRNDPDARMYRRIEAVGDPMGNNLLVNAQSPLRTFFDLDEEMSDSAVDVTIPFTTVLPFTEVWRGLDAKWKMGAAYTYRDRSLHFRRFGYLNGGSSSSSLDFTAPVEEILRPENIGLAADGAPLQFYESTLRADKFKASQEIAAAYGMLELPILADRLRVVGGVRGEYSYIRTRATLTTGQPGNAIINTLDPIPGVNLIYSPLSDMNVRYGYSRTVSRPEFRELTPTDFPVPDGERTVRGDNRLQPATIDSHDLRWEWFFSDLELASVSFFYKDLQDAIEQVTLSETSSTVDSFRNADAWLWGIELEGRKNFGFLASWLPHRPAWQSVGYQLSNLMLLANVSIIDSQAKLQKPPADVICNPSDPGAPIGCGETQTSSHRTLQGQPEYTINASLQYTSEHWGIYQLLYNTVGRKIVAAGVDELPDIYEEPRHQLDLVWTGKVAPFGRELEAKLAIENLLNDRYQQTQDDISISRYQTGVRFSAGVSYKF